MIVMGLTVDGRGQVGVSVREGTLEDFKHFHEEIAPTRTIVQSKEFSGFSDCLWVAQSEIDEAQKQERKRTLLRKIKEMEAELEKLEDS